MYPFSQPARRPRTRKLSHRSLRKALLKAAEDECCSYADMVKRSLGRRQRGNRMQQQQQQQVPPEDIFEAFRDYLGALELGLAQRAAKAIADANPAFSAEDIFKVRDGTLFFRTSSSLSSLKIIS